MISLRFTCLIICMMLVSITMASCSGKNKNNKQKETSATVTENNSIVANDLKINISQQEIIKQYERLLTTVKDNKLINQTHIRLADLKTIVIENELISGKESSQYTYEDILIHYQQLLTLNYHPEDRAKLLYKIASLYDLLNEDELLVDHLNIIIEEYKESEYYIESLFRRAEYYFSVAFYEEAIQDYIIVKNTTDDERFNIFAYYKEAWSYFRLAEYNQSIDKFFALLDQYKTNINKSKDVASYQENIIKDAYRVIALSFSHLEGVKSVRSQLANDDKNQNNFVIYQSLFDQYIDQERYFDAIKTYEVFIEDNPTYIDNPKLYLDILSAHKQSGDGFELLKAKENMAKLFTNGTQYFSIYLVGTNTSLNKNKKDELSQIVYKNLAEVCQHHHAVAQKTQIESDYNQAISSYLSLIKSFPYHPNKTKSEKLLAELYYDSKNYTKAINRFSKLSDTFVNEAKSKKINEKSKSNLIKKAAEASYFTLLSVDSMLNKQEKGTEEEKQWLQRKIDEGSNFIKKFPNDKRMPNVLGNIVKNQLNIGDLNGAVINSKVLVSLEPPASSDLRLTAYITIANAEFDKENFEEAESSYKKVLTFTLSVKDKKHYENQLAISIYKQAEELKKQNQHQLAGKEYYRSAQVGNTKIKGNALFDAINSFIEAKSWKQAIATIAIFKKSFQRHPLLETIPDKLAFIYGKTNEPIKAAHQYALIANNYKEKDPELARQALLQSAELYEESKQYNRALIAYIRYTHRYPKPSIEAMEATSKVSEIYKLQNKSSSELKWHKRLLKKYATLTDRNPRMIYLASNASFAIAEVRLNAFKKIKLTQPLNKSLALKNKSMEQVLKAYKLTAELGSAEFITASNHRIAQIYQLLAHELINSEPPRKLTEDQKEEYGYLMEEQAIPFEDLAIMTFESNTDFVLEEIYDKWIKASFNELKRLSPAQYDKNERLDDHVPFSY